MCNRLAQKCRSLKKLERLCLNGEFLNTLAPNVIKDLTKALFKLKELQSFELREESWTRKENGKGFNDFNKEDLFLLPFITN